MPVHLHLIGICVEFGYGGQAENSVFATSITIFLGGAWLLRSFSCEFGEDPSALSLVSFPSIDFGLFDFADFLWFFFTFDQEFG